MKLPDCTKSNITSVKHGEKKHKIAKPFMFIVWDTNSKIPLYISRICAPDRDDESNDGSVKDKDKVLQPKNKWNVFASFLGLFKKKPIVKKELETVDIPATITQSQKLDP
uniref:Uncharacterized protein n=1 Tax=Panagrolaimus davidi TaxID=227884 RepID=A0A914QKD4_9BILA